MQREGIPKPISKRKRMLRELPRHVRCKLAFYVTACFIGILGVTGCAVALPAAGAAVAGTIALSGDRAQIYVTNDANEIEGCEHIKDLQATSYWGGLLFQQKALEKTMADLTHLAARTGANVLLIKSSSKSFTGSHSEGAAYRCQAVGSGSNPTDEFSEDESQDGEVGH